MTCQILKNKNVVITGGNAGIGRAIAKKFAEEGANLFIFGTNCERGAEVVNDIKASSPCETAAFFQVDVSKSQAVSDVIKQILEQYGPIDILINNAGITRDNLLLRMSEGDWDDVMDVNLKSVYNTCKGVVRPMMKAKKGKIINITSVVGLTGNSGQSNYSASKSGILGFTKSLAKELASRNICVNCIAPGFIETRMTDVLTDAQREQIVNNIPMGRIGDPVEIANAALFLASDHSDYITGQVLTVDGGMVM